MGNISSNSTYMESLSNKNEKTRRFPSIFQITGISIKGKLSLAKLNRHFKFKTAQWIFRVLITCASFSPWIRYNLLINSKYTVVTVCPQRSHVILSLILTVRFQLWKINHIGYISISKILKIWKFFQNHLIEFDLVSHLRWPFYSPWWPLFETSSYDFKG